MFYPLKYFALKLEPYSLTLSLNLRYQLMVPRPKRRLPLWAPPQCFTLRAGNPWWTAPCTPSALARNPWWIAPRQPRQPRLTLPTEHLLLMEFRDPLLAVLSPLPVTLPMPCTIGDALITSSSS